MADGNIFISYRRGADSNAAGRLYDRLERNFESTRLFFDVDSIPLGVDFAEHIDGQVAKCDVQLVVIGPGWVQEIERLSESGDFVRLEIEAALRRSEIPVVPVLLEGAEMPREEDLPDSLRALARRNAIVISHANFSQVVDGRLTEALRSIVGTGATGGGDSSGIQASASSMNAPKSIWRRAIWIGAVSVCVLAVIGVGAFYLSKPTLTVKTTEASPERSATSESEDDAADRSAATAFSETDTEPQGSVDITCAGSTKRDSDVTKLHPALREKIRPLMADLKLENIPFEVFEAYRSPARQESLYAKGRTEPGPTVTWLQPWNSVHQFGLAVYFVLKVDGNWSWDNHGENETYWKRLNELAKLHGLTPIYNSRNVVVQNGELQLPDLSVAEFRETGFPFGGDRPWAANLFDALSSDNACLEPSERSALLNNVTKSLFSSQEDWEQFRKLQTFVGRYIKPQNTTQEALAAWRIGEVTAYDLRNLTEAEATAILKVNYYDECRCGEMPARTALAVYDAAVFSGAKRAIMYLQTAINNLNPAPNGKSLEVNGIIGPETLEAAQSADPKFLSEAIIDEHSVYLRSLETFHSYGRVWMSRLSALRSYAESLQE